MYKMYKTGRDLNAQPTPQKKCHLEDPNVSCQAFQFGRHQRTSRPLTIWVTMLVFPPKEPEPPLQFFFLGQMDNS